MSKSTSRNLYLASLGVFVVGAILIAISIPGGKETSPGTYTIGKPGLFFFAWAVFVIGGIVGLVAWIGALVKMAQLGQWVWFILLLVASGITMLVYIFAGPTTPKAAMNPAPYPQNASYPQNPPYPQS